MKRIFIAVKIDPGERLLKMLGDLRHGLARDKIKWTPPENMHLTLVFLGDTGEDKIKEIADMVEEACRGYGIFYLTLKGAGIFRNLHDPRIIWAGFEVSEQLIQLFNMVKKGLADSGITTEDRTFNPHLTLGRIKHLHNAEILRSLLMKYEGLEIQKQEIGEVILYESILHQTGPVYIPLGKFPLK